MIYQEQWPDNSYFVSFYFILEFIVDYLSFLSEFSKKSEWIQ